MALLGEKSHYWEEKSLLGEKCIVLTMTQFIQKINKKNPPKISPTKVSEPHQGGGLGGWDNVQTLAVFFVMAPLRMFGHKGIHPRPFDGAPNFTALL